VMGAAKAIPGRLQTRRIRAKIGAKIEVSIRRIPQFLGRGSLDGWGDGFNMAGAPIGRGVALVCLVGCAVLLAKAIKGGRLEELGFRANSGSGCSRVG
jgi:hypothetical protein